jgi:hypothetical protein
MRYELKDIEDLKFVREGIERLETKDKTAGSSAKDRD